MEFQASDLAIALLGAAAVLTLIGVLTLVHNRVRARRPEGILDHLPAAVGFLLLLAHLVLRARELGRFPVGNLAESAVFLSFLLVLAYLGSALRFRHVAVEIPLLALAAAFIGLSLVVPTAAVESEALANRWFVFHTVLSFLAVTALLAGCVVSLLYLVAESRLKAKHPGSALRFLPSLVACDRTGHRLLALGFLLLSLGIISGWLWGREAGRTGGLGPKETWSLLAWVIYGALLLARWRRGFSGRRAAILAVAGAAVIVGAVLGIRP